ncbi:Nonsense-mediated mRNA decay protein 5 [Hypoxylon texense]
MSRRPAPSSTSTLPPQNRQNEYFVPRDGIDREVITADICRYLGNDALVRPGTYENPQSGQIIQGYYINAYRNLTTAMIEDLKADSARWDQERRQQSASRNNAAGGTIASRDSNGVVRLSNSPIVQYRNSDTHQSRQYYGPTESGFSSADPNRDPYGDATPRYPGTGSAGYTGAAGSYASQYPQGGYSTQQGYTTQSQFQSPSAGVNYPPMSASGFSQPGQDPPYQLVGADSRVASNPQPMYSDPYSGARDPRDRGAPITTMPASRTTYATSGAPAPQGYPSSGSSSGYFSSNPPSQAPVYATQAVQPADPFYGRGAYTTGS